MGEGSVAARERAAFLCALQIDGSVASAARKAGIKRSRAYHWRKKDPVFAAEMEAARAAGREALAASGDALCGPDQAVWRGAKQGPRMTRIKAGKRWKTATEQVFLDELASHCNVNAAAAKVGFSTTAAYRQRRRRPELRAAWDAAIDEGVARLEAKLLRQAMNGVDRGEGDAPPRIADADEDRAIEDTALAMNVLKAHGGGAERRRGRAGVAAPVQPSIEAVREKVLAGVRAIRRGLEARAVEAAPLLSVGPAEGGAHVAGGEGQPGE